MTSRSAKLVERVSELLSELGIPHECYVPVKSPKLELSYISSIAVPNGADPGLMVECLHFDDYEYMLHDLDQDDIKEALSNDFDPVVCYATHAARIGSFSIALDPP